MYTYVACSTMHVAELKQLIFTKGFKIYELTIF